MMETKPEQLRERQREYIETLYDRNEKLNMDDFGIEKEDAECSD
jgi:hypothetical protein